MEASQTRRRSASSEGSGRPRRRRRSMRANPWVVAASGTSSVAKTMFVGAWPARSRRRSPAGPDRPPAIPRLRRPPRTSRVAGGGARARPRCVPRSTGRRTPPTEVMQAARSQRGGAAGHQNRERGWETTTSRRRTRAVPGPASFAAFSPTAEWWRASASSGRAVRTVAGHASPEGRPPDADRVACPHVRVRPSEGRHRSVAGGANVDRRPRLRGRP